MVGLDRVLTLPLVSASLAAGTIHLAVVRDHLVEDSLSGIFFIALGIFQLGWAVLYARRPQVGPTVLALAVNALVLSIWLVTRTAGLPFGAHPGVAEPIGIADLFASAFELVLVIGTSVLVVSRLRRMAASKRFSVASADLVVVMTLVVITLTASYAMADIALNGGHPTTAAESH